MGWSEVVTPILIAYAAIAVILLIVVMVWRARQKLRETWHTVAEGELQRVEYRQRYGKRPTGQNLHAKTVVLIDVTVVYFRDGRTFLIDEALRMIHPRGTAIRIEKNGFGQHRFASL